MNQSFFLSSAIHTHTHTQVRKQEALLIARCSQHFYSFHTLSWVHGWVTQMAYRISCVGVAVSPCLFLYLQHFIKLKTNHKSRGGGMKFEARGVKVQLKQMRGVQESKRGERWEGVIKGRSKGKNEIADRVFCAMNSETMGMCSHNLVGLTACCVRTN